MKTKLFLVALLSILCGVGLLTSETVIFNYFGVVMILINVVLIAVSYLTKE